MWQCSNCEYLNEDIDESCQKCGAARAAEPVKPEEPAPAAASSESADKSESTTNALTIVLIIACVLAIGAVGYLAWQRGLIGRMFSGGGPATVTESTVQLPDIWADAPPVEGQYERKFRPARSAIDDILAASANAQVAFSDDGTLTDETDQTLRDLAKLGNGLVWQYQEFENGVAEANDPRLGEYAQFIRDRFAMAMASSLDVAARAYSRDVTGGHPAYLLSDEYVQAADGYGLIDTAELKQIWARAAHARLQRELDGQYQQQYRELAARVEALHTIHSEFNKQLSAMPPYTVRSGILGKDARDLLELLGELADKIQEMVIEFEEYQTSLKGLEPSDRMTDYIAQFESLAQTDHLYAFEEIYKLYEQDKELSDPVYAKVAGYYQFALDHWSEAAMRYQEIYQNSEVNWAMRWGSQ